MSHMFTLESLIDKERLVPRCLTLMHSDCVAVTMFMHQNRFQGDEKSVVMGKHSLIHSNFKLTFNKPQSVSSPVASSISSDGEERTVQVRFASGWKSKNKIRKEK